MTRIRRENCGSQRKNDRAEERTEVIHMWVQKETVNGRAKEKNDGEKNESLVVLVRLRNTLQFDKINNKNESILLITFINCHLGLSFIQSKRISIGYHRCNQFFF